MLKDENFDLKFLQLFLSQKNYLRKIYVRKIGKAKQRPHLHAYFNPT